MEVGSSVDAVEFKVNELLKEVRVDYSPALTKVVNDTVFAIKEAISKIPDDFQGNGLAEGSGLAREDGVGLQQANQASNP